MSLAFGCFLWDPHGAVNDNPSVAHLFEVLPLLAPAPVRELQLCNGPIIWIDGEAQIGVVNNGSSVLAQARSADASHEFVSLARFDACGRSAKRRL